jgi:hypothetical protein
MAFKTLAVAGLVPQLLFASLANCLVLPRQDGSLTFEAEDAELSGTNVDTAQAGFSGMTICLD